MCRGLFYSSGLDWGHFQFGFMDRINLGCSVHKMVLGRVVQESSALFLSYLRLMETKKIPWKKVKNEQSNEKNRDFVEISVRFGEIFGRTKTEHFSKFSALFLAYLITFMNYFLTKHCNQHFKFNFIKSKASYFKIFGCEFKAKSVTLKSIY